MLIIIIINWNVRELLRQCLCSLYAHATTHMPQHIIVVDNASDDGSVTMLRKDFSSVYVVANKTNRGFTGGNNDGLALADELIANNGTGENFLFLLNPDTELKPNALDDMLAFMQAQPSIGLMGPRLIYDDGSLQSSRRRFPTLATMLFESTWVQRFAPKHIAHSFYMRDKPDDETCDADWVVGAAMLVRHETYKKVGGLDEQNFFMYSEETDWCKRIKHAGWRVVYFPHATVLHHEGKSSGQVSARRNILFNTSKIHYTRKHMGAWQAVFLRGWLLAQYVWQIGLESAKWLAGSARTLRAARVRAYWAVLRSGLR